jgi:hypothetical protein
VRASASASGTGWRGVESARCKAQEGLRARRRRWLGAAACVWPEEGLGAEPLSASGGRSARGRPGASELTRRFRPRLSAFRIPAAGSASLHAKGGRRRLLGPGYRRAAVRGVGPGEARGSSVRASLRSYCRGRGPREHQGPRRALQQEAVGAPGGLGSQIPARASWTTKVPLQSSLVATLLKYVCPLRVTVAETPAVTAW